jgi:hypothetical protein
MVKHSPSPRFSPPRRGGNVPRAWRSNASWLLADARRSRWYQRRFLSMNLPFPRVSVSLAPLCKRILPIDISRSEFLNRHHGLAQVFQAPPLPDPLLRFQRRRESCLARGLSDGSYDPGAHTNHQALPRVLSPTKWGEGGRRPGEGGLVIATRLRSPLPLGQFMERVRLRGCSLRRVATEFVKPLRMV